MGEAALDGDSQQASQASEAAGAAASPPPEAAASPRAAAGFLGRNPVLWVSDAWYGDWTPQEVGRWLLDVLEVDESTARAFVDNNISGSMLSCVTANFLKNELEVKNPGVQLKLLSEIQQLPTALLRMATQPHGAPQKHQVQVGYKIENVGEVDCLRSIFFCHFKMFARWNDRRVQGLSQAQARELTLTAGDHMGTDGKLGADQEWDMMGPDLIIINEHDLRCLYFELKVVASAKKRTSGEIKWTRYFSGWLEFDVDLTLRNFPFDFHDLRICVRSHKLPLARCELSAWEESCTMEMQTEQNEWQVIGHRGDRLTTDPLLSSTLKTYSEFHICIMLARFPNWYVYNVICVLEAAVLLSFGVLTMPIYDIGSRSEVAASLILSIVATKFSVSEHIPRVRYTTLFDETIITSLVLIGLTIVCSFSVYSVWVRDPHCTADLGVDRQDTSHSFFDAPSVFSLSGLSNDEPECSAVPINQGCTFVLVCSWVLRLLYLYGWKIYFHRKKRAAWEKTRIHRADHLISMVERREKLNKLAKLRDQLHPGTHLKAAGKAAVQMAGDAMQVASVGAVGASQQISSAYKRVGAGISLSTRNAVAPADAGERRAIEASSAGTRANSMGGAGGEREQEGNNGHEHNGHGHEDHDHHTLPGEHERMGEKEAVGGNSNVPCVSSGNRFFGTDSGSVVRVMGRNLLIVDAEAKVVASRLTTDSSHAGKHLQAYRGRVAVQAAGAPSSSAATRLSPQAKRRGMASIRAFSGAKSKLKSKLKGRRASSTDEAPGAASPSKAAASGYRGRAAGQQAALGSVVEEQVGGAAYDGDGEGIDDMLVG